MKHFSMDIRPLYFFGSEMHFDVSIDKSSFAISDSGVCTIRFFVKRNNIMTPACFF